MKKICFLICLYLLWSLILNAQKSTLELTFTALDSLSWLPLDSIKVMNRTKGGDTVLFWPDTVLVLDYTTGVLEQPQESTGLQLLQNYPNPVIDQTNITIYIPREDKVNIIIIDIWGKKIYEEEEVLKKGYHQFRFIPGAGKMFFFSVHYKGTKQCIKIIHTGDNVTQSSCLEYTGCDNDKSRLKRTTHYKGLSYSLGDTLLYIGYFDSLESGILDNPDSNKIYNFQFATNIPCPGIPTVNYEGQVYNTIQIFSQCWLKENMNAGTMIPGNQNMEDNEIIEKYCYDDDPANCEIYGGLYQWDEMMDYKTAMGARGICPEGWHVPTDEEWKVLEGAVDSYYGIGDSEWDDAWEDRGVNAGKNLKSITGWHVNTGSDLFGFTALPGGDRGTDGLFYVLEACCCLWTSTEYKNNDAWAWGRSIHYSNGSVYRSYNNPKGYGFSIRCLRD